MPFLSNTNEVLPRSSTPKKKTQLPLFKKLMTKKIHPVTPERHSLPDSYDTVYAREPAESIREGWVDPLEIQCECGKHKKEKHVAEIEKKENRKIIEHESMRSNIDTSGQLDFEVAPTIYRSYDQYDALIVDHPPTKLANRAANTETLADSDLPAVNAETELEEGWVVEPLPRVIVKMHSAFFITLVVFFLLACSGVDAYAVLDPSKLPSCAFNCQILLQAQDACVPPAAPVSNQNIYQSCYCSSAYLTQLYSTPTGLCDSACSASDEEQIQSWYTGLCHGSAVPTPADSTPSSTTSSAGAPSSTTSSASSASSSVSSSSQNSSNRNSNVGKSWIASHYGWVIFLIVLVLFIVAGIIVGLWLRRRQKRKADATRFSSNAHLPGPGSHASPYDSGVLSPADGAFVGSRNHPQMTMVPDAGSEAAFERYSGYGVPPSRGGSRGGEDNISSSPHPAAKGARAKITRARS